VCGRFSFAVKTRIIEESFDAVVEKGSYKERYNCAPSQNLAVISNATPGELSYYRWGLIPGWAKDASFGNKTINAKAETILEKPSFRNPFRKRRCLVPADSFYEWSRDADKKPWRILMCDGSPFAMAGIWDSWYNEEGEELRSFSIITTIANEIVAPIHHRMPVLLGNTESRIWLSDTGEADLTSLLQPFPSEKMKAYPISKLVNSPFNDTEKIWEPIRA
jgi:putative SOS response-associated peptidase YedK